VESAVKRQAVQVGPVRVGIGQKVDLVSFYELSQTATGEKVLREMYDL
jgi:hypothetical protein